MARFKVVFFYQFLFMLTLISIRVEVFANVPYCTNKQVNVVMVSYNVYEHPDKFYRDAVR